MEDQDDWKARDEAEWERQDELRHEYAAEEYEARRANSASFGRCARNAHRCQCSGEDWPGSCPGPANCPLAEHDEHKSPIRPAIPPPSPLRSPAA